MQKSRFSRTQLVGKTMMVAIAGIACLVPGAVRAEVASQAAQGGVSQSVPDSDDALVKLALMAQRTCLSEPGEFEAAEYQIWKRSEGETTRGIFRCVGSTQGAADRTYEAHFNGDRSGWMFIGPLKYISIR